MASSATIVSTPNLTSDHTSAARTSRPIYEPGFVLSCAVRVEHQYGLIAKATAFVIFPLFCSDFVICHARHAYNRLLPQLSSLLKPGSVNNIP